MINPHLYFEQTGPELVAIEIGQSSCEPIIGSMHRALFALGLDIRSYRARPDNGGLVERIVLERHDGGVIDGALNARARAAILNVARPGLSRRPRSVSGRVARPELRAAKGASRS